MVVAAVLAQTNRVIASGVMWDKPSGHAMAILKLLHYVRFVITKKIYPLELLCMLFKAMGCGMSCAAREKP